MLPAREYLRGYVGTASRRSTVKTGVDGSSASCNRKTPLVAESPRGWLVRSCASATPPGASSLAGSGGRRGRGLSPVSDRKRGSCQDQQRGREPDEDADGRVQGVGSRQQSVGDVDRADEPDGTRAG